MFACWTGSLFSQSISWLNIYHFKNPQPFSEQPCVRMKSDIGYSNILKYVSVITLFQCGWLVLSMLGELKSCSMVKRITWINDHMGKLCVFMFSIVIYWLIYSLVLSVTLWFRIHSYFNFLCIFCLQPQFLSHSSPNSWNFLCWEC